MQALSMQLARDESLVTVYNSTPGLTRLALVVDGRRLEINDLADSEVRTVDASTSMRARADNTVTVEAQGEPDGSATILIWGRRPGRGAFSTARNRCSRASGRWYAHETSS